MRVRALLASLALAMAPLTLAAQEHAHAGNDHAKMEHPVTVVVIVRHADKAAQPAADPPLTEVGTARAQALAEMLRHSNVGAVLHTPTTRTRDTALPTARQFGLTPEVLPQGPAAIHAEVVAEAVRKHAGKTVLVVGHSNTVMQYIAALGGPRRPELCDHEYDGIYTLVIAHGETRLVQGRFGPPNPPAVQGCAAMLAPSMRP
jgi:broad specificity phosphatase PhoE